MEVKTRRHWAAWLLLAVFLPMLVLSSVHVHTRCADTLQCSACVQHKAHSGHIMSGQAPLHDCVLCQVFHLTFLGGIAVSAPALCLLARGGHAERHQSIVLRNVHPHSSRAPPFV